MTSSTSFLFHLLSLGSVWLGLIALVAQAQSPPRLLPEAYEVERIVPEGANVILPCPIEADPDTLFFEWYRNKQPLDAFADERYRMQGSGVLKIKSVIPEDTGIFVCRAVNGFGKVDVNVTLIVLGSPDEQQIYNLQTTGRMFDESAYNMYENEFAPQGKPQFTQISNFANNVVQRLVGATVNLKCFARGDPPPQISWFKNGKALPDSNLPAYTNGGHWILSLHNLQASDTGNYTCVAQNDFGSVNASFKVKVIERVRAKPEFISNYPLNITAHAGESPALQCLVSSDIPPNVQWLKHVSGDVKPYKGSQPLKLLGEFFHVLQSTEFIEKMDGTFLSKLVFKSLVEGDQGKYICLAANAMGFTSRSAFLTVLPRIVPEDVFIETKMSIPFPLLIAMVICGAIILTGIFGLILYCRARKHSSAASRDTSLAPTHASSSSSSKAGSNGGTTERKHSYVGLTYQPHLSGMGMREEPGLPSQTRIYTSGQLHRTVPLHSIFL